MADRKAAKRYASALLALTEEKKSSLDAAAELELVATVVGKAPSFLALLKHPFIAVEEKRGILEKVLTGKVSSLLMGFLHLLLEKKRIGELALISDAFGEMAREKAGLARARVKSAALMDENSRRQLSRSLSARLKKEIEIVEEKDEHLLGGFTMEVEGKLFDASIKGRLAEILEKLSDN